MNSLNASGSGRGKMGIISSVFSSRRTDMSDTPVISDSNRVMEKRSNREVWDTPNGSGSRKEDVSCTANISGSRGTESWRTHGASGNRGTEVLEGPCKDTDPRKTTAECSRSAFSRNQSKWEGIDPSKPNQNVLQREMLRERCSTLAAAVQSSIDINQRHTSNTPQQPSAYQDQASIMKEMFEVMKEMDNKKTKEMIEMIKEMDNKKTKEMFEMIKEMDNKKTKEMFEMMKEMDNKKTKEMFEIIKEMDNKNKKEMFEITKERDNKIMAFQERAVQIQQQKEEEIEMLKKHTRKLEARIQELLAKAMAMHQHSEDINDPLRLSAVLERYEMLRLQEWEKVRSCYHWTYADCSCIIKKLFDACEKNIQQRTDAILEVLDFPLWNNDSIQVMMPDIMKLLRLYYHQNPMVCMKIFQEAAIDMRTAVPFLLQCCQIYCLLLLQDPPVKAEWNMNRNYLEQNKNYLEHVDKKDEVNWRRARLLWPIMKRGEELIVKGVVWEPKRMT